MIPPETLAHAAKLQQNAIRIRLEIEAARKARDRPTLQKYGLAHELDAPDDGISPDEAWKRHIERIARRAREQSDAAE